MTPDMHTMFGAVQHSGEDCGSTYPLDAMGEL